MKIEVCPTKVAKGLSCVVAFLLVANIVGLISRLYFGHDQLHGLVPMFDFDQERNIPTLYSSFALALSAAILAMLCYGYRVHGERCHHWMGLSLIFLFLSIDEATAIHEHLSGPVHDHLGSAVSFSFGWMIPYQVGILLIGMAYARFLWRLPRKTMYLLIASACVFLGGAMGFEILAGRRLQIFGRDDPIIYAVLYTFEESLEMIGVVIFIYALLAHGKDKFGTISITMGSAAD